MKRQTFLHIIYWAVILAFLTLFFGSKWESRILAFYFSSLLLPIVIGTTYFFNLYLVPRYLLTGKFGLFALYFFYMLIASLYLEMLASVLSFIIIADYNLEAIKLEGISIFILGITLYLIVFVTGFINLVNQFRKNTQLLESLKTDSKRNQKENLVIRADRKNHQVALDELLYIESLDDYVKVVTLNGQLTTREKITKMHSLLPDHFIRIHRSFVVNKEKVQSYTNNEVVINDIPIPISRTYKKSAIEVLQSNDLRTAEE